MRVSAVFGLAVTVMAAPNAWADEPELAAQVIEVLRDYAKETPGKAQPAVVLWDWTDEQKQQAASFSQRQIVEVGEGRALKITVTDKLPWDRREDFRAIAIGPALLPPTADAVRLRYRVIDGRITVSCGGPTIYFGHSDVHTEPVTLTAHASGKWQTVTLSLHDGLVRNFRRARFARESPVIYYTRWIQEPMFLALHRGSVGEVLIDRVELLHTGRGRPYPTFEADQVEQIAMIADFDSPDALAKVFTATHEAVDFTGEPRLGRATWPTPKLSHVATSDDRRGLLRIEHRGAEEVAFTGIKVRGAAKANAIAIDIRGAHPVDFDELSIDLIAYEGPSSEPEAGDGGFAWERFAPPQAWRDQPDLSFDYYLTEAATRDVSHAFYHARRAVTNGQWTRLIIPLADFVCVYGAGAMADAMKRQQMIDLRGVIAVGLLPSWRQERHATTFDIDRIEWVRVPGEPDMLRSFPQ